MARSTMKEDLAAIAEIDAMSDTDVSAEVSVPTRKRRKGKLAKP